MRIDELIEMLPPEMLGLLVLALVILALVLLVTTFCFRPDRRDREIARLIDQINRGAI